MNLFAPLVGVAGLVLYTGLQAARSPTGGVTIPNPLTEGWEYGPSYPLDSSGHVSPWDNGPANLDAFLYLLRIGESSDDYGALVGGGSFNDYSHHPGWTDSHMVTKSRWVGKWNSHAAGAYQFQPGTFKLASDALGLDGRFYPDDQDAAAVYNLKRKGAYDAVIDGDIRKAHAILAPAEWISLKDKGVNWTLAMFQQSGGVIL